MVPLGKKFWTWGNWILQMCLYALIHETNSPYAPISARNSIFVIHDFKQIMTEDKMRKLLREVIPNWWSIISLNISGCNVTLSISFSARNLHFNLHSTRICKQQLEGCRLLAWQANSSVFTKVPNIKMIRSPSSFFQLKTGEGRRFSKKLRIVSSKTAFVVF